MNDFTKKDIVERLNDTQDSLCIEAANKITSLRTKEEIEEFLFKPLEDEKEK